VVLRLAGERVVGLTAAHGELAGLRLNVAPSRSWRSLITPVLDPRPAGRDPGWAYPCGPMPQGILRWTSSPPTCCGRRSTSFCRYRVTAPPDRVLGPPITRARRGCQAARTLIMYQEGNADSGEVSFLHDGRRLTPPRFDEASVPAGARIIRTAVQAPV